MGTSKIYCHNNDLENLLNYVKDWNTPYKDKALKFLRKYQRGEVTGKISTPSNLIKLYYDLKICLENLTGTTKADVIKFKERLLQDQIRAYDKHKKKYNREPYKLRRKNTLFRTLKEFFKHAYPNKDFNTILNVKIIVKNQDNDILSESEYNKLLQKATGELKAKVELLYWLGCRVEEMHNIRISDVMLPKGSKQFVEIRLREEFSKTAGRTIHVSGKKSLSIIKKQLAKRISDNAEPEDPLFATNYRTTQKHLQKLGNEIIGKSANAHLWRHTCATRMASQLNRQQLCVWFGWQFASPMPDRYIKRSGVDMQDVLESFERTNMEELEKEITNLKILVKKVAENEGKISLIDYARVMQED